MKNHPSYQSILALSFMIFFISDIQGGIGPILAIYLRSHLGWDTSQVGMALDHVKSKSDCFSVSVWLLNNNFLQWTLTRLLAFLIKKKYFTVY